MAQFSARGGPRNASKKAPTGRLGLEWVYGYETEVICGRNLFVLPGDRGILYAAAAVVVIYEVHKCNQRHYLGHSGRRVLSLAVQSTKEEILCASGERGAQPRILVWNVDTLETVYVLGETFFRGGIISVFFVEDFGLVGIDASATHSLGYWRLDEVKKSAMLAKKREKAHHQDAAEARRAHWAGATECDVHREAHILSLNLPAAEARADRAAKPPAVYDGCATGSDSSFCTVGPGRHLKFWTASLCDSASKKKWKLNFDSARWIGISEKSSKSKSATLRRCLYLARLKVLITASDDGICRAWRNYVAFATFSIAANQSPILALGPAPNDDTAFLTGDATGAVRLWRLRDENSSIVLALLPQATRGGAVAKQINIDHESAAHGAQTAHGDICTKRPYLRDLAYYSSTLLFAATKRGVLWMLEHQTAAEISVTALAASHFALNTTTALRGLSLISSENKIITAGGDGLLCIYNALSHRLESWVRLDGPANCCDTLDSRMIVVGLESSGNKSSGVSCHNSTTLAVQQRLSTDGAPVDCVRVCERFLVAGTRDGCIRIACHGTSSWSHCWRPQYGKSRLTQIDIEPRNICLRLTTSDRQLLFYDVKAKRQCGDDWHGQSYPGLSSTVGSHLLGAVNPNVKRLDPQKHYHLTAAHVLGADDLLAVGDADGAIRVLHSPCITPKAPGIRAIAHGSAVAAIKWSNSTLVSVGGGDRTLMQWKFTEEGSSVLIDPASVESRHLTETESNMSNVSGSQPEPRRRIKTICAICYLCGTLNPARSIERHIAACEKKWRNAHKAANRGDVHDPGPIPPNPYPDVDYAALSSGQLARLNESLEVYYRQQVLRGCKHCGRRFTRHQLPKHQASCCAAKPFKPLNGRRMPLAEENEADRRKASIYFNKAR